MTMVLVVEDDDVYRQALARALRREGYEPVEAAGVESAGVAMENRAPAYAVIDGSTAR